MTTPIFEVSTRFHFVTTNDIFSLFPFFRAHVRKLIKWQSIHYGLELFQNDIIFRVNMADDGEQYRWFLELRGPERGNFANIREVLEEEITHGVSDSTTMGLFGAKLSFDDPSEIIKEMVNAGYDEYMSFNGINLVGEYQPLGFQLKLISCPSIKWPLMLEIVKTAPTEDKARSLEVELYEFITKYRIKNRMVHEEPPALLYKTIVKRE